MNDKKHITILIIAAILTALTTNAQAGQSSIILHTYATHPFTNKNYNSHTFGIGYRYSFNSRWSVAGGLYRDSDYTEAKYLIGEYQIIPRRCAYCISVGTFFGMAAGYPISPIPVAGVDIGIPVYKRISAHLLMTPPTGVSASALQIAITFRFGGRL